MDPLRLDYQASSKRKPPRGGGASLILRISDPRDANASDAQRVGRGLVYAIIMIALLGLLAFMLHFVIDYAWLLDTISR